MNLSVFCLGLHANKQFKTSQKLKLILNEYLNQLILFSKEYAKTRYQIDLNAELYTPDYTPKSYDELREWDRTGWRQEWFGKDFQMYIGYNLDFNPWGNIANGYAECVGKEEMDPRDMMFSEMQEYHPLLAKDPYTWWKEFSRTFFHELDHQLLWVASHPAWLKGVHKAINLPLVEWNTGRTDSNGHHVVFYTQQDARTV